MRKSFLLIASLILATGAVSTANAQTDWGLGFMYREFPVGVFVAPNDQLTIHGGFRFAQFDDKNLNVGDVKTEVGFVAALVWDFWSGSSWGFGFSPGVAYVNASPYEGDAGSIDSGSLVRIPVALKGHWDPTDNVSIWFGHGVVFDITSPIGGGDSTTDWGTFGANWADLGFTIWAP